MLNQLGAKIIVLTVAVTSFMSVSVAHAQYSNLDSRIEEARTIFKDFTLVPLEFYSYDVERMEWVEKQTAFQIDPKRKPLH